MVNTTIDFKSRVKGGARGSVMPKETVRPLEPGFFVDVGHNCKSFSVFNFSFLRSIQREASSVGKDSRNLRACLFIDLSSQGGQ